MGARDGDPSPHPRVRGVLRGSPARRPVVRRLTSATRPEGRHRVLASVHIYPLKGCRAVDLDEAVVEPWGLAGDRRWLLVDADCQFMTQRKYPALARLVIRYGPGTDITASCDGYPSVRVAAPDESAELLKVTVWRSTVLAAAAGPE